LNYRAELTGDTLTLENNCIARTYRWNGGHIVPLTITDKRTDRTWALDGDEPDCAFPGLVAEAPDGALSVRECPETTTTPAHLRAEVAVSFGGLELKRVFRLYPDCPAIACDYYLRGRAGANWESAATDAADLRNIENAAAVVEGASEAPVMTRLNLPGRHWRLTPVQFFDITDRTNTLVQEAPILAYRGESRLVGNLLFAEDVVNGQCLFVIKEAPCSNVQLAYPGWDFIAKIGDLRVVGLGVSPEDLDETEWTRCYGVVTGVAGSRQLSRLTALRDYQKRVRIHKPGRDDMVLMNTWGDRGQDTRLCEVFCLEELEAGSRLGISHFQLDDGWQAGQSSNSAFKGGSLENIWDNPDYWTPHPERFPNGLEPVTKRGKELGIEVCLWFNPSKDDSYARWREDADALIRLHREYGIRTFKIDGVMAPDKRAEENLRRMFDTVMEATGNEAVFNLDVTAGRRFGYHYFNEYGNVFVENRYTDWSNYYPHWTLRNLWMLSRYVPPENLQIEFLNVWRNHDRYDPADPFAPGRVPFDYAFAITMMAQPLAWFEGTGLPEEAFSVAPLIAKYREHQHRIHSGTILPIGDEPCGTGWTGFQSIRDDSGYLIVFREGNDAKEARVRTWLLPGQKVECRYLLGHGADFTAQTDGDGRVRFGLPQPFSFALYEYRHIP
jgi:alpha-galactosidase